jgi:hypothetical protein
MFYNENGYSVIAVVPDVIRDYSTTDISEGNLSGIPVF